MLLSKVAKLIKPKQIFFYKKNATINHITANSKLISKKSIYIANYNKNIKKIYIQEAIKNGCIAIITNKKIDSIKTTQFIVKDIKIAVKLILFSLKPFRPNNIIGITGTNGKTSVVWLVSNFLKLQGIDFKSLGTLGYYKNGKKIKDSYLTTPEQEELYQYSFSNRSRNFEFIFEASSHGISKKRIEGIPINIAAITNISQDHLDYHKTLNNYRNTKFNLFLKYLTKKQIAIINDNIKGINKLKQKLKKNNFKIITYGKNSSDINCKFVNKKTKIKIFSQTYFSKFFSNIDFELENLSCYISCCIALGLNNSNIIKFLPKIVKPDGRMQLVDSLKNRAEIYIDYAHTPEALKKILLSKYYNFKKPNLIFGCGGNRDKDKRAKMGKIAKKYANKVYITDDNPRSESPKEIRNNIQRYCPNALNIGNRRIAIKTAINNLKSKEILIIAGKGHEKKQILKDKVINFNDFKVAKYFIKKNNNL